MPRGNGDQYQAVKTLLRSSQLHTICEEAHCPNIAECFGKGTAVFLILGRVCTRACAYCNVMHGQPTLINLREPNDVARSVKTLGLRYVVITSVTRDDLPDGGAGLFSETVSQIRALSPGCQIELLIPDFQGDDSALETIVDAHPDVINHNIEVVHSLFPVVRPQGDYQRSLRVLRAIKSKNLQMPTKSGFMIGLGESSEEIIATMHDLRESLVDFLTIGQYLQPTLHHAAIKKYYTPSEFQELKKKALHFGFAHVESGPLVRSSYHAENALFTIKSTDS